MASVEKSPKPISQNDSNIRSPSFNLESSEHLRGRNKRIQDDVRTRRVEFFEVLRRKSNRVK